MLAVRIAAAAGDAILGVHLEDIVRVGLQVKVDHRQLDHVVVDGVAYRKHDLVGRVVVQPVAPRLAAVVVDQALERPGRRHEAEGQPLAVGLHRARERDHHHVDEADVNVGIANSLWRVKLRVGRLLVRTRVVSGRLVVGVREHHIRGALTVEEDEVGAALHVCSLVVLALQVHRLHAFHRAVVQPTHDVADPHVDGIAEAVLVVVVAVVVHQGLGAVVRWVVEEDAVAEHDVFPSVAVEVGDEQRRLVGAKALVAKGADHVDARSAHPRRTRPARFRFASRERGQV